MQHVKPVALFLIKNKNFIYAAFLSDYYTKCKLVIQICTFVDCTYIVYLVKFQFIIKQKSSCVYYMMVNYVPMFIASDIW